MSDFYVCKNELIHWQKFLTLPLSHSFPSTNSVHIRLPTCWYPGVYVQLKTTPLVWIVANWDGPISSS